MADWIRATFRLLAERAAGPNETAVAGWLDLCGHAGLTPAAGPLAHDLLLPRPGRPQLGINVFGHGAHSAEVREQALRFAASLGGEASRATTRLAAALPDTDWHAGFVYADGRLVLKLYLSASPAAARELGLDDDAFAFGVDVDGGGSSRARSYRRVEQLESDDAMGWSALSGWLGLVDPPGHSHRVLTSLGRSKRTLSHIFGPEASLAALHQVAEAVATLDPDLPSCLEPELLGELEQLARGCGAVARPVAYEIDLFSDGSRQTDALVTLAEVPR